MKSIRTDPCKSCVHAHFGEIMNLCLHSKSLYHVESKQSHHTQSHMLQIQGNDCKLFTPKVGSL